MKKLFVILSFAIASSQILAQNNLKEFTLEDIFKNNTFGLKYAPAFNVMNDGKSYSVLKGEGTSGWKISALAMETGEEVKTIFSHTKLEDKIVPGGYEFSNDESMLLITMGEERIYRHSSRSTVWVVRLSDKAVYKIPGKVMYPTLSPDNSNLAYVRDNNLYIYNLQSGTEKAVTTDGVKNKIINGGVDWVYEEEFSMSRGFEWNNTGSMIAYYKFDESAVKEFSMDWWGNLYPDQERWKYPKAGEDNSKVRVFVHHLHLKTTTEVIYGTPEGVPPGAISSPTPKPEYIPRIQWTADSITLSFQTLNRTQNEWKLVFNTFKKDGLMVRDVLKESAETYIDITDNLHFAADGRCMFYTSEKSGYNHIYMLDLKKYTEKAVTSGNWDVTGIKSIDEKNELVYYTSSEVSPTEDHFYCIGFNGKKKKDLVPEAGNHIITMGKGNQYFTDMSSTIASPYSFRLYRTDGKWSKALELNESARELMAKYKFGSSELSSLTTESGQTLNYWIMKPADFDPSKKYPVLMHVYGGPGHNTVRNSYGGRNYLWHQLLTEKGYIVVSVDNRGTGNRGRAFKHSTYLQLGKLEHEDQTAAAKWFATQTWVDKERIGIWGWSFGGYMSSLCITKSADVFKAAIAVAPVTNWRYYDNIYTERFLRTPQENPTGYDENSPINFTNGIKGKYLIIHGTGDDNVHFQNSVEMVNAMIKSGVSYDSEFYPNRNHGIGDRAAQYHLYKRMTGFILDNL